LKFLAKQTTPKTLEDKMAGEGTVTRHSRYYTIMKNRVEGKMSHPINNGVKMQAHHLISCEGMKESKLGKDIKKTGYDINQAYNMAFIPSTLQGACHLGIQVHAGNHTADVRPNNDDDDDEHPDKYHEMVEARVRKLEKLIKDGCVGKEKDKKNVVRKLNNISRKIANLIQNSPKEARLTKLYNRFQPGVNAGCSNQDSVTKVPLIVTPEKQVMYTCSIGRNHFKKQNEGQRDENITSERYGGYALDVGA
jgi:hypothetical protein